MKNQCKLRPNHEVMETLMTRTCGTKWHHIEYRKDLLLRVPGLGNLELTAILDYMRLLNPCQRCKHYQGDYPEVPK